MEKLLKSEILNVLNLKGRHNCSVKVDFKNISAKKFELQDDEKGFIASAGEGVSAFSNINEKELKVIAFDNYLSSIKCKKLEGKPRCDFIVCDKELSNNDYFILDELTTATNNQNLEKPISNAKGIVQYSKGKKDKAQHQLLSSLIILFKSDKIKEYISKCKNKYAVFSYKIKAPKLPKGQKVFNAFVRRPKIMEMQEVKHSGSVASKKSCREIEAYGFGYYEMMYPYEIQIG